jgi:predicted nucleic acid-binding protein
MIKRGVLDTAVAVAALRTRAGGGNTELRQVANRRLVPWATPPLFLEYEDVLKRPKRRIAHGLTLEMVDECLAELAALVEPVEVRFLWRPGFGSRATKCSRGRDQWPSGCLGDIQYPRLCSGR